MPIYEYECNSCGKVFEKMQNINDENREINCEYCGEKAYRKISKTSYHLTGSGFYNTDNRNSCCADKNKNMDSCLAATSCPNSACSMAK